MKSFLLKFMRIFDILLLPFLILSAYILKLARRVGIQRLDLCRGALLNAGVFPLRSHYYEPQFDFRNLKHPLSQDRNLSGIDWNVSEQLSLLENLHFGHELIDIPCKKKGHVSSFYFNNGSYESGDAEIWYQMIRHIKPRRIIEVGSGNSTLMAIAAINANKKESANYSCNHVCVEPYEMPWLEESGVTSVYRSKVEEMDLDFFKQLEANDILFIDSSHIIRPQGDVLFEILGILPSLAKGVIVHFHDIFSPKNYLTQWLTRDIRFWNEQYLLEAFLTHNETWKVFAALNYLHHNHYEKLSQVAPHLTPTREPGAFYIQRVL